MWAGPRTAAPPDKPGRELSPHKRLTDDFGGCNDFGGKRLEMSRIAEMRGRMGGTRRRGVAWQAKVVSRCARWNRRMRPRPHTRGEQAPVDFAPIRIVGVRSRNRRSGS